MRESFLPFARPSITDAEIAAVTDVLRSGWITTGARSAELEEAFAASVGCRGAVAVTSGTAAMHLVLQALDVGPGDEVVTPSMTWVSTVNLITLCGATPVFADVDRDTLLVSPQEIERRCTDRTRLIIPVHFAGAPVDLDAIRRIGDDRGIRVIEDAAHAAGAAYRGRPIGSTGTAIFSFHPIKNMTTAEGGMVCSDDQELLDRIRRLRFHGLGVDAFDRDTQGRRPQAEVIEPGLKYNLPDLCAALGIVQLGRLEQMNARRRELAARYRQRLREIECLRPLADPDYPFKHAWHLFVVRLDTDKTGPGRLEFMEEMKRRNIGSGIHFQAVHLQRHYARTLAPPPGGLPNTEWNSTRICSLPLFSDMSDADVDDVVDAAASVLGSAVAG